MKINLNKIFKRTSNNNYYSDIKSSYRHVLKGKRYSLTICFNIQILLSIFEDWENVRATEVSANVTITKKAIEIAKSLMDVCFSQPGMNY